jgi:hypothetical protein
VTVAFNRFGRIFDPVDLAAGPLPQPRMQLRCPHCRNSLEIVDEKSFDNVTCPSCGNSFSLRGYKLTDTHESGETTVATTAAYRKAIDHRGSRWKVGDRIQNRWEVKQVFQGGMGEVYQVFDHDFGVLPGFLWLNRELRAICAFAAGSASQGAEFL